MTVALTLPRLGETMEEARVTTWLVAEGARFARGDVLLEVETDKTAVEVPALGPGRLARVLAQPGQVVQLGEAIAEIDLEGAADWTGAGDREESAGRTRAPDPHGAPDRTEGADRIEGTDWAAHGASESSANPRATPPARRAARRAGVKLASLAGTGRRGRIELRDVEGAASGAAPATVLAESRWGPPEGPRVLLVHGFAGDRSTLDVLGHGLGRAGLSVRAVDLPGHGETPAEATDLDDLVRALAAQLDPAQPTHLVAHSLGAAVAVRAAARAGGVASLVLIAPAGLGERIDGGFIAGMAEPVTLETTRALLERLSPRVAEFSTAMVAAIQIGLSQGRLRALARDFAEGDRQRIDVRAELADLALRIPVRVLAGHADRILDWRDATTVSPRIAVHHFPQAGHMPHWDAPEAVRDLLAETLTAGAERAPGPGLNGGAGR